MTEVTPMGQYLTASDTPLRRLLHAPLRPLRSGSPSVVSRSESEEEDQMDDQIE